MQLIFTPDADENRATGYATVPYSSSSDDETVVETNKEELASVFQTATDDGETLGYPDESIDAAINDPLSFHDYLILVDSEIQFDPDYTRDTPQQ